jgi:hypothetical protein
MGITDFRYPETERSRGDDEGDGMLFLFMEYRYDTCRREYAGEGRSIYPSPVKSLCLVYRAR